MSEPMNTTSVKSSLRTLKILEYFSIEKRPLRLMEIGEYIEGAPSSTSALLRSMEQQGYILYDANSKTYMVTLKTALLGAWVNDTMISDGSILKLMMSLYNKTKSTVVLGAMSGLGVQYIHVQKSKDNLSRKEITAGSMRHLLRSAMGFAFLSSMPEDDVLPIVRRLNAEEEDASKRVPLLDVLERLRQCKEQGYAYSEGATTKGAGMIAFLLATPPHQPALALGVGGPIPFLRSHRKGIVSALRGVVEKRRRMMEGKPGAESKEKGR